jgi:hypothetical protein
LLSWVETVPLAKADQTRGAAGDGESRDDISDKTPPDRDAEDPAPVFPTDPAASQKEKTTTFAILEPQPDQVFSRADQIRIRARVPLGGKTTVRIRGEPLSDTHLGQKSVHTRERFEEITWYAVRIYPGWNSIVLESTDLGGTTRTDSVRVALASRPAAVTAERRRVLIPADGRTGEVIRFGVRDERGLSVADGFVATVIEGDSIVTNVDARPHTPGLQVVSRDGYLWLNIRPGAQTGRRTVTVDCDGMLASCDVAYVSAVRPTMATGVVNLLLGAHDTGGSGSTEGLEHSEDGFSADAEARVFVQSALPHGFGLTARLDSERRYQDPLLKQINPEVQYPVYGDESELRFAAPSRTGNYVSVDKGESFLRYGDFRTPLTNGQYLYYHEVATGVTGAMVGREGAVRGFVTDTDYVTYRDEIEADGTSGFYYLTHAPLMQNSEQIFLETRNRFQSEIILDLKPLVRNRDYTVNVFDGSILFKEPVPITDRYLNPVYIIAIYKVKSNDTSRLLYGLRGDLVRDKRYNVGAAAVANGGDRDRYALFGMEGGVRLAGIDFGGEFARSEHDLQGEGNAFRLEAGINNRLTDTKIYFRRVDSDFENPSLIVGSQELGTRKAGVKSRVWLGDGFSLYANGFVHNLHRTGTDESSLIAVADFTHPLFQFYAGGRAAKENDSGEETNGILSVLGLKADIKRRVEFRTHWEKNLGGDWVSTFPDRLASIIDVPFGNRLRLSATHEYLTAPGRPGTNQFHAGIESRLAPGTTAYTRYRMNRTASDERMGAVAGLRQMFRLSPAVTATAAVEGYQSMDDSSDDEYLSIKTALANRKENSHVIETRYEYRWETTRSKHLVQLVASAQMRRGFSFLLNDVVSFSPDDERKNGLNYRGKLGLAYRPVGPPVQTLFTIKNFYEKYSPSFPDAITWKLVLSGDVNVMPSEKHELRFKYAYKRVEDYSYGISVNTNSDLILGQYVYRFARSWDVDLWGRVMAQRGGTADTGVGLELGRTFFRSIRVAAGYGFNGFEDPDITGTNAWSSGFGLRIQLILSDWILQEFEG